MVLPGLCDDNVTDHAEYKGTAVLPPTPRSMVVNRHQLKLVVLRKNRP